MKERNKQLKLQAPPAHSRLIGVKPCNEGLTLYVHKAQTKKGGRIEGEFDLEKVGSGYYAIQIKKLLNERNYERFDNAKEFFKEIGSIDSKITHIVNRNNLEIADYEEI